MFRELAVVTLALVLIGCGPELSQEQDAQIEGTSFAEASPLSHGAKQQLQAALALLQSDVEHAELGMTRKLARRTLARITAGDVLLGSLQQARGIDRWHMCKDYELPACDGAPTDDPQWLGDEEVATMLETDLDGYMWGNRLYFSFRDEMSTQLLALTLVHEVNHILNRSECSYYSDVDAHAVDDTRAYIEEYRAFFVECLYQRGADAVACDAQAAQDVDGYGFDPDLTTVLPGGNTLSLAESLLEDTSFGRLVPYAKYWPGEFGDCAE